MRSYLSVDRPAHDAGALLLVRGEVAGLQLHAFQQAAEEGEGALVPGCEELRLKWRRGEHGADGRHYLRRVHRPVGSDAPLLAHPCHHLHSLSLPKHIVTWWSWSWPGRWMAAGSRWCCTSAAITACSAVPAKQVL